MIHQRVEADYLATFLSPLRPWLDDPATTDLFVNAPGELWVERAGGVPERHAAPVLTQDWLWQLAQQMARVSHQGISRAEPLLSAGLPCGTRVQVVAPPATRGAIAMAFRRQVTTGFSLADLHAAAMFDGASFGTTASSRADLARLYAEGDPVAFLTAAVAARQTILVSGGTASGKTTLLNALLRAVPAHERLVAIEDSPELALEQPNAVGLIAVRGRMGESSVDADDLLQASLRLRPDRILLGELRGPEALTFLHAINSGHPGSISTIHADSPDRAIDQLCMLAARAGAPSAGTQLRDYVTGLIDVVVQVERTPHGRRVVSITWRRFSASQG